MPLSTGYRLGSYEVTAKIGEGGMGEVYQARDTKLDRNVALKVLPEAFTSDPDRLARFQREARVLASLNHPNIGGIHGLEDSSDITALVLELIEGPTLADRIKQGPIPIDDVLPIARQIAEALEAAHDQGVVHRDLKPANIKVREDGTVKVLDFGLAKALQPEAAADPGLSMSPTMSLTAAATQMGMVIGTAAYMSPEQAKGKVVDKRADVWAFGAVLFEMLTGQRAFPGDDVSDTLATVLKFEPDWDCLPPDTPVGIRRLLRRCLAKDPTRRLREAGSGIVEIDEAENAPEPETAARASATGPLSWRRPLPVGTLAVAMAVIGGLVAWSLTPTPPAPVSRFVASTSPDGPFTAGTPWAELAISPDGRRVVYVSGPTSDRRLYVRPLDALDGTPNLGGLISSDNPFFSPDGAWLGFATGSDTSWKKVSILGGPPVTLWDSTTPPAGASWGPDDTIIFAQAAPGTGLYRGPAGGGEPEMITTPDETRGETNHWWPEILPGGRAVLFTIVQGTRDEDREVAVLNLETGETTVLVPGGSHPRYAATGHIVYGAEHTLRAVPFDLGRLEVTGDPVPVVEDVVMKSTGAVSFALSPTGTLVYATGGTDATGLRRLLAMVDRDGTAQPLAAEPQGYEEFSVSPDGTKVAVRVNNLEDDDVWVYHLTRDTLTRLTFDPADEIFPTWTPDGTRVAFGGATLPLSWKAADGTGEVETLAEGTAQYPQAFTPDGGTLVFEKRGGGNVVDQVAMSLDGSGATTPLLETEFSERNGALSPDGRWLAYDSNESGRIDVYVVPFPEVDDGRWQISTDGGRWPVWSPTSNELFYRGPTGLMAATFDTDPTFTPRGVTQLFEWEWVGRLNRRMAVMPDGQQFLLLQDESGQGRSGQQDADPPQVIVVENWFSELERLVPVP